jgi:hypothetical protein
VNNLHSAADVIRKVGLLALVGFSVILLSGPIVAILSVVLSLGVIVLGFALVGFLVWLPFRILTVGSQVAFQNLHDAGKAVGGVAMGVGRVGAKAVVVPPRAAGRMCAGGFRVAKAGLRLTWSAARFIGEVGVVAAAGVLVGVIFGLISGTQTHNLGVAIPMNAFAGGLIGAATGIVMTIRERRAGRAPTIPVTGQPSPV